jgi:hypothetical protein
MRFIEGVPNYGQEFVRLNRFLQERPAARIEYSFFIRFPVTSGQDNYRDGLEINVCLQRVQDNKAIPGR